jgi:hypothetical protein
MTWSPKAWAGRVGAVALVLVLGSCGSSTTGPSGGSTPGRSRSVIGSFAFQLVGIPEAQSVGFAFDFLDRDVVLSAAGDLDAVVNWTFASNNVNLYLTSTSCSETQFAVVQCTILRSTEGQGGKPRTLTASGLSAGTYRVWVVNLGNTAESGSVEVGVTR